MDVDGFITRIAQVPLPEAHADRVILFVRELAQGAVEGLWDTEFAIFRTAGNVQWVSISHGERFEPFYQSRWGDYFIAASTLESMGYVQIMRSDQDWDTVMLSRAAFDLLREPPAPPSIFISYKRDTSLLFALLIEARLRHAGIPGVFVDKELNGGDKWAEILREQATQCEVMIVPVAEGTLDSKWVQQEIAWSQEKTPPARIIPIAHAGFQDIGATNLAHWHWITVMDETPFGYEDAIARLLNALGYSTY